MISSCSNSNKKEIDFQVVENVLNQQAKEWNNGSIDGFMKGYWQSDSLRFITKRGIKMGYDSVSLNYKKHYNTPGKMGHLSFTDLHFYALDSHGELVQCTGKWKVASETEAEQSGLFSLLLKNLKGEWKIIVDHTW